MDYEKRYDCFVISPIGEHGSYTRNRSDKLLTDIIKMAIDENKWKIIRSDQIASVNVKPITDEIIKHIHQSELCIIDLTDTNPNVMYEFGIRYETGKPFILLAQEGQSLPFDVASIRTIFYNLDDLRDSIECIRFIKRIITELEKNGLPYKDSDVSLSSISARISRIERAVQSLSTSLTTSGANHDSDITEDIELDMTPNQQFRFALQEHNIPAVDKLLSYFKRTKSKDVYYDQYLEVAAREGSNRALNELLQNIYYIDELSEDRKVEAISYISIGLNKTDRQEEGLRIISPVIDKCIKDCDKKSSKATLLNQKARLITDNKKRIETLLDVIKLDPNDPSFYYNLSVCYENAADLDKAKKYIDQCIAKQKSDNEAEYVSDHVGQAIDVYAKLNDKEKVNEYLRIIQRINPKLYVLKQRDANRYLRKAKL